MLTRENVKQVFESLQEIRYEAQLIGKVVALVQGLEFDWSSDSESSVLALGEAGEVRLLWGDGHVDLCNLLVFPQEYLYITIGEVLDREILARLAWEKEILARLAWEKKAQVFFSENNPL